MSRHIPVVVLEEDAALVVDHLFTNGAYILSSAGAGRRMATRSGLKLCFDDDTEQHIIFWFGDPPPGHFDPPRQEWLIAIFCGAARYGSKNVRFESDLVLELGISPTMEPHWKRLQRWVKKQFQRQRMPHGGNVYIGPKAAEWLALPEHCVLGDVSFRPTWDRGNAPSRIVNFDGTLMSQRY